MKYVSALDEAELKTLECAHEIIPLPESATVRM